MSDRETFDTFIQESLRDRRVSRGEKRDLKQLIRTAKPSNAERAFYRHLAFDAAKSAMNDGADAEVIDWLEDTLKLLLPVTEAETPSSAARCFFAPEDDCPKEITRLLRNAHATIDICVFTITDDRITRAILEAARRRVRVRILTDDDKSHDRGSDVEELVRAGIPLRTDRSDAHMHHKFALFDRRTLLTGSYNWTRSASRDNQENFIVTDDARLVESFSNAFERLWSSFDPSAG